MHLGPYDNEPETVKCMHEYIEENGYKLDINDKRYHHEIYLSDPRRCRAENLKQLLDIQSRKSNNSNFSHYFPGNDKIFIKRLIWKISNKLLSNSMIILKR